MRSNFTKVIAEVLSHEGGYVDHPKDPGGATNLGITHKTLAAYRGVAWRYLSKREVRELTKEEAEAIYKKNYWDRCLADDLPVGVDYAVMDYAVNSGVSRSVKALQRIVGAKADGVAGLGTVRKVQAFGDAAKIVSILCARRLSFMQRLRTWATFGKGWSGRVKRVEKVALGMLLSTKGQESGVEEVITPASSALTVKEMAIALGVW